MRMILTKPQAEAVRDALRALDPVGACVRVTLFSPGQVDIYIGTAAIDIKTSESFPPDRESYGSRAAFVHTYDLA